MMRFLTWSKNLLISLLIGVIMNCGNSDKPKKNKEYKEYIAANELFMLKETEISKLKKDALIGSPEAAYKLFQYYEFGQYDSKKSLYWVTIAAENGHDIGQHNLAYTLMNDEDPNNRLRACYWARKSVKNGNKEALELLKEIESKVKCSVK